jgi:hypothetical protein
MDMGGTEKQLEKRLETYRKMAAKHIERHARKDARGANSAGAEERFEGRQRELNQRMEKIEGFLKKMGKKEGRNENEIQSNAAGNESAMIHSPKGFIQGYIGIAAADQKSQVITNAEAFGSANETEHLAEMLDGNTENLEAAGVKTAGEGEKITVLGDPNYFSEENFQACAERGAEAVIPGSQAKRRLGADGKNRYGVEVFKYHEGENYYERPQGKRLEYKRVTKQKGVEGRVYQASLTGCRQCPEFAKCSWSRKGQSGQVRGKTLRIIKSNRQGSLCRGMREKFETVECRDKYADRIQIVEPVFADIRYCKGLNRFTLRGKGKVNSQWLLYCVVHNLGKYLKGRNAVKGRRNIGGKEKNTGNRDIHSGL